MRFMLSSERLQLIPFTESDIDLLHDLFTDAYIRKYLWDDQIVPREETVNIIQQNQISMQHRGWGLWGLQLHGDERIIGFAGLWIFFDEQQPQLLYALLREATGQGYGTEAAYCVARYAFDQLGFSYLDAAMDRWHRSSRRLVRRLGMKRLKKMRIDGKPTLFYRVHADQMPVLLF